ncbi:MAG: fatty acid desaturase family protein [Myxococcaceae bacterium]
MLRHASDWRSVAYLVAVTALGVVQWNLAAWNPALYAVYLFLFVAVAVISHNHNHVSMWRSRTLNLFTNYLISVHYGHPAIAWVPTHNQNHHKYNNREGDTGRSPAFFKKNHLLALLVYPTLTGLRQQQDIKRFFKELWARDRRGFWAAVSEYVVFFGFLAVVLALDWRKAVVFYVLPQQFALFAIQVFNYVQHVEADAESDWNHSRNFVSPVLNALLFNNGYHTVHHLKPGVHWSQTPALDAEHAQKIHPALRVRSWWGYMVWTFLVRPLVPGARAPALTHPQ